MLTVAPRRGQAPPSLLLGLLAPSRPVSDPATLARARALTWPLITTQIAALASGEVAQPVDPGQLGGGGTSPEQMVALACMCSSPIVVDARKRTKGERPEADASDVRLVQRQRGSVPHQPKPPVLPPFGMGQGACEPLVGAQGQQMWPPPQQQFPQQMQPHPNATISSAQLGVVAAPVCGGMLSAISEPVVEVLEACGDALIEMQAHIRPSCLHLPASSTPAASTRPLLPRPSRPLHTPQPSAPSAPSRSAGHLHRCAAAR